MNDDVLAAIGRVSWKYMAWEAAMNDVRHSDGLAETPDEIARRENAARNALERAVVALVDTYVIQEGWFIT